MRKEALKLSNAKKATTKSVQTEIDAARDYGNISKLYTKLPVGIQVSEPIDRDSQASRNDASTTTGFTKSFILGIHLKNLTRYKSLFSSHLQNMYFAWGITKF